MRSFPNILSSYNPDADFFALEALKRPGLSRWNKGVELWQSGLPTLDVMIIIPGNLESIVKQIEEFVRRWRAPGNPKHMVIRLDSLSSNSVPPTSQEEFTDNAGYYASQITKYINDGLIPSLWALPELRIKRRQVAAIMFESDERIIIEMLSAGHDVADIAKGHGHPANIITMKPFAPSFKEISPSHLQHYINVRTEDENMRKERINDRINFLAKLNNRAFDEQAEIMKTESGLFSETNTCSLSDIEKLFRYAKQYAEFKALHNLLVKNHAIAATRSAGSRWNFDNAWDAKKYNSV